MVLATLGHCRRQKRWMSCALIACIFDLLPVALAATTTAATATQTATAATTTTTQTVTLTVTVTVTETQTQTQVSVLDPNFEDLPNPQSAGSDQTASLPADPIPLNYPTQCDVYDNVNACSAAPQGYVATCVSLGVDGTTCTLYQCCPATPQCSQLIVPVGQNTQCCPMEAPATAMNDQSTQCCQQDTTPTTCPGGLTLTVMSDGQTQINTCCQTQTQSNSGAGVVNSGAGVVNSGAGGVNSGAGVVNSGAGAGGGSVASGSSSTGAIGNSGNAMGNDQQIAGPLGRLPLSGVQPTPAPSPTPAPNPVDDIPIEHVLGVLGGALFIIMLPAAYVMIQGKNKPGGKSGATASVKSSAEATEAEASLETPLKDN